MNKISSYLFSKFNYFNFFSKTGTNPTVSPILKSTTKRHRGILDILHFFIIFSVNYDKGHFFRLFTK